jgi:hypothetical protein
MIKQLAWKEYREQRAIWIAMALLAEFVIFCAPAIAVLSGLTNQIFAAVMMVIMVAAYGLICGSILFAGEEEFQTLPFLDRLAGWRTPLWGAKVLTGCGLTTGLALLLAMVFWELNPWGPSMGGWWWLWTMLLVVFALDAFAVGLMFSAISRNALAAAGLSVIAYAFTWLLTGGIVNFFLRGVLNLEVSTLRESVQYHLAFALCLHAGIAFCALWVSWRIFCRDDVRRGLGALLMPGFPVAVPSFHPREQTFGELRVDTSRWRSTSWLMLRQSWATALLLCAAGFALVATFRPAADVWLLAWPAVTLVVGAVCGLGSFLGEQAWGAERFLGDQRLPIRRIWTIKTGAWLLLAVAVCALVFVGVVPSVQWVDNSPASSVIRDGIEPFRGLFVVLWLVYGFGIGQFCARVSRKPVIAAFVSLLLCPVAVIWWPSLVCGGLSAWQVLAAPLVLLVATRLALWEWVVGGHHGFRSPILLGSAALAALCLAGGIEYRVWQVPNLGEPFDVGEYVAKLPTREENKAGSRTHGTLETLERHWWESQRLKRAAEPKTTRGATDPLDEVLVKGWRPGNNQLNQQLKYVFSENWAKGEGDLPDLPLGMLGDPRYPRDYSISPRFIDLSLGVRLLRVRAIQLQAGNRTGDALQHLSIALAIIRNAQNHASYEEEIAALSAQKGVFDTFEKCLLKSKVGAQSLQMGLKILSRHASELPSFSDHLEAEYVVIANNLKSPDGWLKQEVLAAALEAPWEQQRQKRLLNATFAGLLQAARSSYPEWLAGYGRLDEHSTVANVLAAVGWQRPSGSSLTLDRLSRLLDRSLVSPMILVRLGRVNRVTYDVVVCRLRALELQVALALFQLEKRRTARTLDELVPSYFSELPVDPFTGRPFGYRVSVGEQLSALTTELGGRRIGEPRTVAPGQGIVWSAGPDAIDNGGISGGSDFNWYDPLREKGADLIFIVPKVPVTRDLGWLAF